MTQKCTSDGFEEVSTVATSAQIPLDAHRDQFPRDIHFHEMPAGDLIATHVDEDGWPKPYRVTGATKNPRSFASADAVVIEGRFLTASAEGRIVRTQHPYAGRADRYNAEEWLTEPALLLERLDRAEGGASA